MPLSAGYPTLISDLDAAYQTAKSEGEVDGCDPDAIIAQLADDMGNAIHTYMETALVSTDIITPGGQTASAAASTAGTPGVYASPGTGSGIGEISFTGGDVNTLISDIETAHLDVKAAGSEDDVDADAVIAQLAADMMTAIHTFALTALVETDVIVNPGQVISGYMAIAGTTTVPVVATSLTGTGAGEGELS